MCSYNLHCMQGSVLGILNIKGNTAKNFNNNNERLIINNFQGAHNLKPVKSVIVFVVFTRSKCENPPVTVVITFCSIALYLY